MTRKSCGGEVAREHDKAAPFIRAAGRHGAYEIRPVARHLSGGAFIFVWLMLVSGAVPEKPLAVYSTAANYSLPVVQRQGQDYVGLLELLDPLGTVNAKSDPPHWRLHYNNVLGEFTDGKKRARVQGRDADLAGKFLIEHGPGLIPVASLNSLLPRFLGGPATLREESNRLFIGNIATHFTATIAPDDPSRLTFHFTAPVNPSVAGEPGKLRLTFRREPLTGPASPMLTFSSKLIPAADYSESNGEAEIDVTTSIPLMAGFSPDGRTITLAPAKSASANLQTATNAFGTNRPATPPPGAPTAAAPATAATGQAQTSAQP